MTPMMCSAGEYVDWALTAINFAFFYINIRFLWGLRKEWDRVESAVRTAEALRAQARKLRDGGLAPRRAHAAWMYS
jgi:hypothetical protein